jgi:hypothetical protein
MNNFTSLSLTQFRKTPTFLIYLTLLCLGFNQQISAQTTWTGGASTNDWLTAGNWSSGVPSTNSDVYISTASIYPIISSTVVIESLTIDANATLEVASGNNLTVTGSITNSGTFTLNNNANLLQGGTTNTNTGNIIVKRNSATLKRLDYTLWSSPVTGQGLYAFSPFTYSNRFYTYNSNTDVYNAFNGFSITGLNPDGVNGTDTNNAQFSTGTGYLIRMPWDHPTLPTIWTGTFTGVPNSGNITLSGLTNGLYYAIGNPYPSTIDADQFIIDNSIGDNPLTPGDGLYFWRKTNNSTASSYATYTTAGGVQSAGDTLNIVPNGVIQVGEGFIVKATSASLVFNNAQRIANNDNQFLRSGNAIERHRFWLNLSDSSAIINQMMVAYMTGATQDIDAAIDGRYINDSSTALNSLLNNEEFTVQGRGLPFDSSDIVPLAFKAANAGNYSIAIDHIDGLFADGSQSIYLKDNLTTTVHDLNTGAYSFSTAAGIFNNRFEIIYQSQLGTNNPTFTASTVIIYNQNNDLVINAGSTIMKSVKVFDIRGRLLNEKANINASRASIIGGLTNGVLLVQITSEDGAVVTRKVIR